MATSVQEEVDSAAGIIADAGGSVVGRTKLQKIAYFLEAMHLGTGFDFEYKHYGPYSERLSTALRYGDMLGTIEEDVKTAAWGGRYSIFKTDIIAPSPENSVRYQVIALGNAADPVELELAATAVLLAVDGYSDPWAETEQRKPEKAAGGRIDRARVLLGGFKALDEKHGIPTDL